MATPRTRNSSRLVLAAALLSAATGYSPRVAACTNPPPPAFTFASIGTESIEFVDAHTAFADVKLKGYTIFGGMLGNICTCSIMLPGGPSSIVGVESVSILLAGTDTPHPGFSGFADDPESTQGWLLLGGGGGAGWGFGFSTEVVDVLTPNVPVDICFRLRLKLEVIQQTGDVAFDSRVDGAKTTGIAAKGGKIIVPKTLRDAIVGDLVDDLASAVIGTDKGNPDGSPMGAHTAIVGVAGSMFNGESWTDLAGAQAGAAGMTLLGTGALGDVHVLQLVNALPDSMVELIVGTEAVHMPLPGGGVLVPAQQASLWVQVDGVGNWVGSLPHNGSGITGDLFVQAVQFDRSAPDDLAVSNALQTSGSR